jgi:hypothetical protein
MKLQSRLVLFSSITILVLLVNLAMPVAAFADDSALPDAVPTEAPVVTTPDASSTDTAPAPVDVTPVDLPQHKIGQPQAVLLNPGDPEDVRLITRGVIQKGDYVTVTVNFTGIFVLVAR